MMLFLTFITQKGPSCLQLHSPLQKSCSVGHYALPLLTPLEVREASDWVRRVVRTYAGQLAS